MSGGPPHHPHNRQVPTANAAWNHLQVPSYFPRPQHAHMSNEHPLLHQPTWHTPTTEPLKNPIQHSHLFNLEQMLSDRQYPRHSPGVDLSVTRNGNQNGDMPAAPISLSVRDTNKINSLVDIQGPELKSSLSPGLKPQSPIQGLIKPAIAETKQPQAQASPKSVKKAKRVDSILERLVPQNNHEDKDKISEVNLQQTNLQGVVIQASSHDENSNSSGLNVPAVRDEEVVSPFSNEDSLDSNKSRRKRKPSKTVRVIEQQQPPKPLTPVAEVVKEDPLLLEVPNENKIPERRKSPSPEPAARKSTSSESETIDKIAAMVQEIAKKPPEKVEEITVVPPPPIPKEKAFVAVEDKLQEMFAGLEDDPKTPEKLEAFSDAADILKLESTPSTSHDNVTSTSGDNSAKVTQKKKRSAIARRHSEGKKKKNQKKGQGKIVELPKKSVTPKKVNGKAKLDAIKDVYAYDSGSNASSGKSRGPFVQIRGPRDSPLSVCVVNTPTNEEDAEKKPNKSKKYHDDSEYRNKVRSRGLHCSTLSNKYDAQTKDASWICAFCKRGPYSPEFSRTDAFYTPGDLFGPYAITDGCAEFDTRLDDPYDVQFKSKKVCRALQAGTPKPKKSKRKNSENIDELSKDFNLGIAPMGEKSFEIWAHEDCIVWSPGVYLIGPKIVGLEEAVWTSSNVNCTRCHLKGANVCCVKRGCPDVVHLGCAYSATWCLDENNYKAYCVEHREV